MERETDAAERETAIDEALCRGVLYDAIASGLRPPSLETLARLGGQATASALLSAAAALDAPRGSTAVASAAEKLVCAARAADLESLRSSHGSLFGHTARGKAPPYETEYGVDDPFRQSQELADLGGFYRAFGLSPGESNHERCDHAAVECEFLHFLAFKEAYEIVSSRTSGGEPKGETRDASGDSPRDVVRRAERLFLRDHLGRFGRAFAISLAREADHPFHRALGELLLAFLTLECESFGLKPGAELIPLRSTAEDNVPMACGGCPIADVAGGGGQAGGSAPEE